jgi:hypothetical protein
LSSTARASLFAEEGGFALPVLLEITHGVTGYANPLRIVNNTVDLVYDGDTYSAFGFKFDPPDVGNEGAIANARLTICAIDQQLASIIRSTSTPPTVQAVATFYSDESGSLVFEPVASWLLTVGRVQGNAETIQAELIYEDRLDNEVPADEFRPHTFPGAF